MVASVLAIAVTSVFFVWAQRGDLLASLEVLNTLEPTALIMALALSAISVANRGGLFRSAHRAVGLSADLMSMIRVSAAAYALNKVVKTGGLGGIALFVRHGRRRQHPAGQVTAAYVVASSSGQLAMLTVVLTAITMAAVDGVLQGRWLIATLLFVGLACTGLGLLAAALRSRETVRFLYAIPHRILRAAMSRLGRASADEPNFEHADRFHGAAAAIRNSPRSAMPVLVHAVTAKFLGAGVLAASLAATGADIGFGKALIVYSLALIAAAVGVLPGGIGAVEASMGALLSSFGVAPPVAIAAVLTFRLLDLWLPLGVGLVMSRYLDVSSDTADVDPAEIRTATERVQPVPVTV